MAVEFPLDLVLIQGKDYETPKRVGLRIRAIGTDGAKATKLVIDNKPTGSIWSTIAPLHKINTNLMGPLELGGLYYVVPPETKVIVDGPSGAKMRCKGEIVRLAPGEAMPAADLARFAAQPNHHLTYISGTYSHGTDVALVKDAEVEVVSLTPLTIERYKLAHPVLASVANYTAVEGDLGIRFYLANAPLDDLLEVTKVGGIDITCARRPPKEDVDQIPFSLAKIPIEVPGDVTLSIRVRNIKGADISPATGTSLTFNIDAICEYLRRV